MDEGYLYRGARSGGNWSWEQVTNDGNLGSQNLRIWLDQEDAQTIRLIDKDWPDLGESIDNGVTWTWLGSKGIWDNDWPTVSSGFGSSPNGDSKVFSPDPSDPNALLWVDTRFVYQTRDKGRNFAPAYAINGCR